MAHSTSKELTAMNLGDLTKEVAEQRGIVEHMRLGIEMKKEKNTGRYRLEKRQLARMEAARTQKARSELPKSSKPSTVPVSHS